MTTDVRTVDPATTLRDTVAQMRAHDIGIFPVVDDTGPIGIVTDRDIAIRGVGRDLDPATAAVTEVMTPNIAAVLLEQNAQHAAHVMRDRRIRRVLVVDDANQIVGLISLGDLVSADVPMSLIADVLATVTH